MTPSVREAARALLDVLRKIEDAPNRYVAQAMDALRTALDDDDGEIEKAREWFYDTARAYFDNVTEAQLFGKDNDETHRRRWVAMRQAHRDMHIAEGSFTLPPVVSPKPVAPKPDKAWLAINTAAENTSLAFLKDEPDLYDAPKPASERCHSCGATDPKLRYVCNNGLGARSTWHAEPARDRFECRDPWHDAKPRDGGE